MASPWPSDGKRRASVNSFGVGGANAHVILDDALHYLQSHGLQGHHNTKIITQSRIHDAPEATAVTPQPDDISLEDDAGSCSEQQSLLLPLSAADEQGVIRLATALSAHLNRLGDVSPAYLQDLAFTLSAKRGLLPWKTCVVGANAKHLRLSLESLSMNPIRATQAPDIIFTFTGQGAQWATMGIELMSRYRVYHDSINFADKLFHTLGAQWSLISMLNMFNF